MVLCKYFMEGYCKYGSRCRYDHGNSSFINYDSNRSVDYSTSERQTGSSILKGPSASTTSFGGQGFDQTFIKNHPQSYPQQKASPGGKFNIHEIMVTVSKDISQSEKGNQWQLSSYSPAKDLPNIQGLEDHSPEELRWECYKALQQGTLPLWQAILHQLFANVAKVNNDLKKKETAYAIIDRWLRTAEQSMQSNVTPLGGNSVSFADSKSAGQFYASSEMQSSSTSSSNFFSFSLSQEQQVNAQPYPTSGSVFTRLEIAAPPPITQQFQPFSTPTTLNTADELAYSAVEDLAESELEAFKMDRFVLGSIPTKPPPKQFCFV